MLTRVMLMRCVGFQNNVAASFAADRSQQMRNAEVVILAAAVGAARASRRPTASVMHVQNTQ